MDKKMSSSTNVCCDESNEQRRSPKNRVDLSNYRFEVLIRETYPYIDEVGDDEIFDAGNSNIRQPSRETAMNNSEMKYFFRNIKPFDERACRFYKPGKIAAAFAEGQEQLPLSNMKQHPVCANVNRKPWLPLLNSNPSWSGQEDQLTCVDRKASYLPVATCSETTHLCTDSGSVFEESNLNPDVPSFYTRSSEQHGVFAKDFALKAQTYHQGAVSAVVIPPKRKPGTGIRLNRKPIPETTNEPEPLLYNVYANRKNMNRDIDKLLDHIDAERLNNLSKNSDQETQLTENGMSDSNDNAVANSQLIAATAFIHVEHDGKSKEIGCSSAVPTAMVQPSLVTKQRCMVDTKKEIQGMKLNISQSSHQIPISFLSRPPESPLSATYSYTNNETSNQQMYTLNKSDSVIENQCTFLKSTFPDSVTDFQIISERNQGTQMMKAISQQVTNDKTNAENNYELPDNNRSSVSYSWANEMNEESNSVPQQSIPSSINRTMPAPFSHACQESSVPQPTTSVPWNATANSANLRPTFNNEDSSQQNTIPQHTTSVRWNCADIRSAFNNEILPQQDEAFRPHTLMSNKPVICNESMQQQGLVCAPPSSMHNYTTMQNQSQKSFFVNEPTRDLPPSRLTFPEDNRTGEFSKNLWTKNDSMTTPSIIAQGQQLLQTKYDCSIRPPMNVNNVFCVDGTTNVGPSYSIK